MPNSTNPTVLDDETPEGTDPQTPETGTPAPGETPETTKPQTPEEYAKEIESLKAALKKTNAESAAHRRKAKEFDDLQAKIAAEKLTEAERAQKEIAELKSQIEEKDRVLKERNAISEVQLKATQMGFANSVTAMKLIKDQIEYDEDGSPSNIDQLLKELAKAEPYLVSKTAPVSSGGATNPSRSASNTKDLSWETIMELQKNPEEYNRRNADGSITRWLSSNPYRYGRK